MKQYGLVAAALMIGFLALFLATEKLGLAVLADPTPYLADGSYAAAVVGVVLLVSDVVLPVPSSLVMVAHGALFGVALGTALSLFGSVGAAAFGFWLGKVGAPLLHRLVSPDDQKRADALLNRWGGLAIIVTRPLPIVAETVAVVAGASPLGWGRLLTMASLGSAPPAFLYALTGATAARLDSALLVFGVVIGITGLVWWAGRRAG